jgi:IS5 family transposase
VDATLIAAPSSTKNKAHARDPEMHQAKKGNQWHFGMKCGRPHFMPNVALVHMWRPAASPSGGLSLSAT